jgi:two-component system, NarL family, nitrate/nitrite response regulator NarL
MELDDLINQPGRRRWWLLGKGLESDTGSLEEALKFARAADNFISTSLNLDASPSLSILERSASTSLLVSEIGKAEPVHAVIGVPQHLEHLFAREAKPPTVAPEPARRSTCTTPTPREAVILRCLSRGCSNKRIARELGITESTVKVHVKALMQKIKVGNRTQAAIWALNNGISALLADTQPLTVIS